MATGSNPLFENQWHFSLIGNIDTVWAEYTGEGIHVGIYDTGIQKAHADLAGNYDASLHWNTSYGSDDGEANSVSDNHGTAVAGIIAGINNTIGGVGVAYNASITSVDVLNDVQFLTAAAFYDSLKWAANFDVMNNSWGMIGDYSAYNNLTNVTGNAYKTALAFDYAASNGRGGLGTIIVKAAGNENNSLYLSYLEGNAQGDGQNNIHEVFLVAATDEFGDATYYSNWGANLLITAPAASVTTDTAGGYMDYFGGTSAATPVVSGVIALILEANEDLGWRDLRDIIALSAQATGSTYGSSATGYEEDDWISNGSSTWNGGGMSYHVSYGYGMIDALAAVRMAEVWDMLHGGDAAKTSSNVVTTSVTRNASLSFDTSLTYSITVPASKNIMIEYAQVTLGLSSSYISDITIYLVDPDGNSYLLMKQENPGTDSLNFTYGVAGLIGTQSSGTWKLEFSDIFPFETNTVSSVKLAFEGTAIDADSIYTFTDDFLQYASVDASRKTIVDTDGGTDWLNLVAVTGRVAVTLSNNGAVTVGGTKWADLTSGNTLENVALGDNSDRAVGSTSNNQMFGGRGDDALAGGGGHDMLNGSFGNDVLIGDGLSLHDSQIANVYRIFQATLGRAPDSAGMAYWAEQLASGAQKYGTVLNFFVNSAEFSYKYGNVTNSEFVNLLYQNVLGRAPDSAGLAYWTAQIDNSALSRSGVVNKITQSNEFLQKTFDAAYGETTVMKQAGAFDDVYKLYLACLGREGDVAGLEYWSQKIATGTSLSNVSNGFTASSEFQSKYGSLGDVAFVNALYQNVLGRTGDEGGVTYWSSQISSGARSRAEVALQFSASSEFAIQTADALDAFIENAGQDDILYGGHGSDTLIGGILSDTFLFISGDTGTKLIVDFDDYDTLQWSGFGFTTLNSFKAFCTQTGDDVLFSKGGLKVTIADTLLSELTLDKLDFTTADELIWA